MAEQIQPPSEFCYLLNPDGHTSGGHEPLVEVLVQRVGLVERVQFGVSGLGGQFLHDLKEITMRLVSPSALLGNRLGLLRGRASALF